MDKVDRAGAPRLPVALSYCFSLFCWMCLIIVSGAYGNPTDSTSVTIAAAAGASSVSSDAETLYEKGRSLERSGDVKQAIEVYNDALRAAPDHQASIRRLKRLRRLGYDVNPTSIVAISKKTRSSKAKAKETLAAKREKKPELDEATQKALDRALEKARIYLDSQQPAEAERELREAQRLLPDYPETTKMLDEAAALREHLKELERAKNAQTEAEHRKALSVSASEKFQEGMKLYHAGDVIGAVKAWREALKIYPDHKPSRNAIETSKSEYEKAIKAKEKAEKLNEQEKAYEAKLDLKYGYETKGDSDIDDVLNTLSNLCGLKIVIGENVEGTVNFRVDKDTTIRQIFNLIQDNYGFTWTRKGDTIIVKRGFKTRVFPLSAVQYKTLKAILEDSSTLKDTSQDLRTILYGADGAKKMPGKELFLNPRTRSLVVTDSENNLKKVEDFLKNMPAIAGEDRPLETRIYKLHPEIAKELYNIIELRLYKEAGQYTGLTGGGRKLYLSNDNTLIVVDYPENIKIVEQILADQQVQQALEEKQLVAKRYSITDMFDIGQREEDLDRRIQTTQMVVQVLEAMLYGPTGKEEANLKGRRMFPNEERGTIHIVDTPANLKRVDDYLASIRGQAEQEILIQTYKIKHVPVTDIADAVGLIFTGQTQTTRNLFLDVQGLDTLGTDESGQEIDISSGFEESSRELFNIQQGGGGQDLTTMFSISYFPDIKTNSLVVITPDQEALDFISNIVNTFDEPPRMLELEQRTVSVSLTDLRSVGLDYLVTNPFRSKITVNPEKSEQSLELISDTEGKRTVRFNVDTFGESRLNFVLTMLEELDSSEVLAAPKMLIVPTLYTRPTIYVGNQEPYVSSVDIDDQGDDDPTNNRLIIEFDRAITGITMQFIPFILNDGYVLLDLMPNKTVITGRLPVFVQGGQQSGSVDTSGLTSLGQPIFAQQAMNTTIRVKSGETVVMGGMMEDNVTESRSSVPLISKLPFLGSLFRDVSYNVSKTTTLWFVTVRIIEGESGSSGESVNVSTK